MVRVYVLDDIVVCVRGGVVIITSGVGSVTLDDDGVHFWDSIPCLTIEGIMLCYPNGASRVARCE